MFHIDREEHARASSPEGRPHFLHFKSAFALVLCRTRNLAPWPAKAECLPAFYPHPFVARTPRDSKFIERVSILNERTTGNGHFRVRFREPPVYTGVRMLENLTLECQIVPNSAKARGVDAVKRARKAPRCKLRRDRGIGCGVRAFPGIERFRAPQILETVPGTTGPVQYEKEHIKRRVCRFCDRDLLGTRGSRPELYDGAPKGGLAREKVADKFFQARLRRRAFRLRERALTQ